MPTSPPSSTLKPLGRPSSRQIALLSTYPPKLCGLATFSAALERDLRRAGHRVEVIRIDDGDEQPPFEAPVVAELVNGSPSSIRRVAATMARSDVAIIQHEYGIFGGDDGDEVITLLRLLDVPSIVVLHTVPLTPTAHQREVLEVIGDLAGRLVVMSATAHRRLLAGYRIDPASVVTIPHGASAPLLERLDDLPAGEPPQLLTWGLLGPGKGIEHAIDALALLDPEERPRYTVAGVTHPKVLARDGDAYRRSLIDRADRLGVGASVTFDDTYRDVGQLTRFVASAALVVLPYDSRDQVTSGVLVDAIAAGRPVIATAFPHAVELLGSGAGIVVEHGDPAALAEAIRAVLGDHAVHAAMEAEARRLAPALRWSAVADQYARLADDLVGTGEPVAM